MRSRMIVQLPAVAVVVAVAPPTVVAMVVEPPLRCAPIRAMATAVLARQHRLLFALLRQQPRLWRKWLLNRSSRKLLLSQRPSSQRCLQVAPVVVVQRPAERPKAPLILLISPIGFTEPVGLLMSGRS